MGSGRTNVCLHYIRTMIIGSKACDSFKHFILRDSDLRLDVIISCSTGVPNPNGPVLFSGLLEHGHTAGGKWWVSKWNFICVYRHSPLLALLPEFCLLSDQWLNLDPHRSENPTVNCVCERPRLSTPLRIILKPSVKILSFMQTSPWSQKDWGPLL